MILYAKYWNSNWAELTKRNLKKRNITKQWTFSNLITKLSQWYQTLAALNDRFVRTDIISSNYETVVQIFTQAKVDWKRFINVNITWKFVYLGLPTGSIKAGLKAHHYRALRSCFGRVTQTQDWGYQASISRFSWPSDSEAQWEWTV